jgi:hypothetical protein
MKNKQIAIEKNFVSSLGNLAFDNYLKEITTIAFMKPVRNNMALQPFFVNDTTDPYYVGGSQLMVSIFF